MKTTCICFLGITRVMCSTAFSGVWIVCDDDGSNPSVTKDHVLSVFAGANTVLRQVVMSLDITAGDIQYINRSAWKDLSRTNSTHQQTLREMGACPKNGNLRIFFVNTVHGSDCDGFNTRYCIAMAKHASGISLAHEVCHVGGLRDIYVTYDNVSIADAGVVREEYIPKDWSGYYPRGLLHTNLITRLLMYAYIVPDMGDIPLGRVYGVYRPMVNGMLQPPEKGMVPVGLQDLNRQPEHADFDEP